MTDAGAEVRSRVEADDPPQGEGGPLDWTDLCLSHALGSNVRKVAPPEEVLAATADTGDPQDSGTPGSKKANGGENSEEVKDAGVGDVKAKRDSTASSQGHTEGYPA